MKPMTKRLAQMTTIYAAKKLWDRVDTGALQSLAHDLYRSTPHQWQENASRFTSHSANELQGNATARFDDVIHQAGLIRLANVPNRRGPMLLALVGGTVVGAAGTLVFLRSETGKSLIEKMSAKVDDMRSKSSDDLDVQDEHDDVSLGMDATQSNGRSESTKRKSNKSKRKSNKSKRSPLHQPR